MICPLRNKPCIINQCMFGVKNDDGEKFCGIIMMMHNIMVIALAIEKKDE